MRAVRVVEWSLEQLDISERPLYQGKASAVFRARDRGSGAIVALKLYKKSALTALNRRQVERELDIHRELQHENIVQLLGTFQDEEYVYMVQEFAGEGDLFQRVKCSPGRRFCELQTQLVILPFMRALVYLHSLGILHRDIKPENVVIASGGVVKLTDFGLAISMHDERPVTRLGTLDYMAPEVLCCPDKTSPEANKDREDLEYCCQVDVWAAGVLAYELLVGRPPFEQGTRMETYQHIMYRDPQMPEFLSPQAVSFIKAALCKDPDIRPTAEELIGHPWLCLEPLAASPSADASHSLDRSPAATTAAATAPPACATAASDQAAGPFSNPFVVVEDLLNFRGPGGRGMQHAAAVSDDSGSDYSGIYSGSDCGSDSHSFFDDGEGRASRLDAAASGCTPARASGGEAAPEFKDPCKATQFELHLGKGGQDAVQGKVLPPSSLGNVCVRSGAVTRRPSEIYVKLPPAAPSSMLPSPQASSAFRAGPAMPEIGPAASACAASRRAAAKPSNLMPDISAQPDHSGRGAASCSQVPEGIRVGSGTSLRSLLARNHSYEPASSSSAARRAGARLLVRPACLGLEALSIDQADSYHVDLLSPCPSAQLMGSISAEAEATSIVKLRSVDLDTMLSARVSLEGRAGPMPKAGVLSSGPSKSKMGSNALSQSPTGREDDGAGDSAVMMMRSSQGYKAAGVPRARVVKEVGQSNYLQAAVAVLDRGLRRTFLPSSGSKEIGLPSELSSAAVSRAPSKSKASGSALPQLRAPHVGAGGRRGEMAWRASEHRASCYKPQNKCDKLRPLPPRELADADTPGLRRTTSCTNFARPSIGVRHYTHSSPGDVE